VGETGLDLSSELVRGRMVGEVGVAILRFRLAASAILAAMYSRAGDWDRDRGVWDSLKPRRDAGVVGGDCCKVTPVAEAPADSIDNGADG
jgi:hypothetical protein